MKFASLVFGYLLISGCSTYPKMSENQKEDGHARLYTYPKKIKNLPTSDKEKTVIHLFSLNDYNNQVNPYLTSIPNRFGEKRSLSSGGFDTLNLYVKHLKEEFPQSLFINSGNAFVDKDLKQQVFKFNFLDFDLSILGANELTMFGKNASFRSIESKFRKLNHPVVISNFFDLTKARNYRWKHFKPYVIKKVNGIKLGFINLVPQKLAFDISKKTMNGVFVQEPLQRLLEVTQTLRRKGVQVVVLLTPEGLDCTTKQAQDLELPVEKVNFDVNETEFCESKDHSILQAVAKAPKGIVDLIITSGKRSKVANMIHHTPVMQNFGDGNYLSWMTLVYDHKYHRVDKKLSKLYQPIQLCKNFFKNEKDCYVEGDLKDKKVAPAIFFEKPLATN